MIRSDHALHDEPTPFGPEVEGLRSALAGSVLELTLDRPERRNALSPDLIRGLMATFEEVRSSSLARVVILTGAGGRAFCAGFDITHISSQGGGNAGAERDLVDDLSSAVTALPVPVIAAVNGAAVGAGCDLAVACDIRIGSPAARFGMPPAKLGLLYGQRGMARLLATVGPAAAREMLLTGSLIEANRAHEIGLLSAIVPATALLDECRSVAATIASNAPLSVGGTKRIIDLLAGPVPPSPADQAELDAIQERVWNSDDALEGARAHRERRRPRFTGR